MTECFLYRDRKYSVAVQNVWVWGDGGVVRIEPRRRGRGVRGGYRGASLGLVDCADCPRGRGCVVLEGCIKRVIGI